MAGIGTAVQAQERITIPATAKGDEHAIGQDVNVNVHVEQFSTPEDRKALTDAFARSGQHGLVDVLEKTKSKGRIRTPCGVSDEIKYIFELPSEKAHLRLITDRRIAFGEAYNSTRSKKYSIGAVDLFLTPDGKGSGTLLPAAAPPNCFFERAPQSSCSAPPSSPSLRHLAREEVSVPLRVCFAIFEGDSLPGHRIPRTCRTA